MLEGLEVSIEYRSDLCNIDNDTLRYDAEHYQSKYKKINDLLKKNKAVKLVELLESPVVTGHTPSMKIDQFYGGLIKFIKTDNLRENQITDFFTSYLTEEGNKKIKNTTLKSDDILVTIIGADFNVVGRSAIIDDRHLPANINQNIGLIRVKKEKINPKYLTIYLNTKYGRGSLHYHSRQTEQVNLNCREVERILVPIFQCLEHKIVKLKKESDNLLNQSETLYQNGEKLLLDTLGLSNITNQSEIFNIKFLSESFRKTSRLDAEYYQKKYEDVETHITANPYSKLAQLVKIQKSIEPGSDAYSDNAEGLPFLRVADYNKFGITQPQKNLNNSYVAENYEKLNSLKPKKQTILFSKDGSVGQAYCLREDADFITSGAILHLTVKNPEQLLPDYLTLVLNSKLVQMQAERDVGGSIILHWRTKETEEVLIPLTDIKTQKKIADLVKKSFALKTESQHLLNAAKHAVEIAIEQDEQSAIAFLQSKANVPDLAFSTE